MKYFSVKSDEQSSGYQTIKNGFEYTNTDGALFMAPSLTVIRMSYTPNTDVDNQTTSILKKFFHMNKSV